MFCLGLSFGLIILVWRERGGEVGMKMFFFACWGWGRGAAKIYGVWIREALKKSVR